MDEKPREPLHKRNYICRECGKIRRAPAHFVPNGPSPPECCADKMKLLDHQQTVAANRLTAKERVDWLLGGGRVVKARGTRQWKPG
ncbi:MAG TPA: hypothetical protein VGY55_00680 [Pirellulales bacterium]|jgi:hypothetical protein|nr:hypothetical protein [Pirellulales bacterium]